MSFFEDASLVLIPSAQKTSKVYSVKPTDGTGDLAFSRSNDTATRVGPDGLIEKVRTNVLLQSNTFSTTWSPTRLSVTSGQSDPNGGTTAWKISNNVTTNSFSFISQTITGRTFSIYAKAGEVTQMLMYVGGNRGVYFDLTDGSFVGWYSVTTGINYSSTSVGGGWYRYVLTLTDTDMVVAEVYTAAAGSIVYNLVSGEGLYIWRSQMELGDIATDYIPTTSAAVSVGPVANVPRLDYLNSSCPRLLLEPQRTNSALYSEQADNSYWLKFLCTITANQGVSPSGYNDADLFTTGSATSVIYRTGVTAGSVSFFVKAVSLNSGAKFYIDVDGVGSAYWNQDGTLSSVSGGTATNAVSYGNGWYRCAFNVTSGSVINYGLASVTGSNRTCLIWGMQNEASATYATSYIPTLGAAVTRGADAASKTGISSLIGQTEGTLFAEFNVPSIASAGTNTSFNISDGTSNNIIGFAYYPTGRIQAAVLVGGSLTVNIDLPSYGLTAGTHKFAFAYKLNDYVLYLDGVQRGSDTSSAVPATSLIDLFAGLNATQVYNQALLFKTRLTNAQLAELTTL